MSVVGEVEHLLLENIPDGRKHLEESHANLDKVASYCETNYLQSGDKRQALMDTMGYTTQSLASVAYQINTLATNFLHLLDMQAQQMADMESSINHLSQTVMIHKEKVARREIGVLTTNKSTPRPQGVKNPGIIFPEQQERPVKYVRKPIDYTQLDEIGHGVRPVGQPGSVQRSNSTSSSKPGGAPTTNPPAPPSTGGLARQNSSPYRVPALPSITSPYAPNFPLPQHLPGGEKRPSYASIGRSGSIGLVMPTTHQSQTAYEPPVQHDGCRRTSMGNVSPYLPPPPLDLMEDTPPLPETEFYAEGQGRFQYDMDHYGSHNAVLGSASHQWVPKDYIEKVVAVYEYIKDKEDELSFKEGAVIYVVKKNDDGWWEGVADGVTGLFPGNYVEPCLLLN